MNVKTGTFVVEETKMKQLQKKTVAEEAVVEEDCREEAVVEEDCSRKQLLKKTVAEEAVAEEEAVAGSSCRRDCRPKQLQKNQLLLIKTSEEGGGCLIATATYGSEIAPQVQMLREIRDNQLMNTESGSAFMSSIQ